MVGKVMLFISACLAATTMRAADTSPIDGSWTIVSVTQNGKLLDNYTGAKRVHEGGRYTMKAAEGKTLFTTEGAFTVDAEKQTIDLKPSDGRYKGHTLAGIYRLDGNTLHIAFAEPQKKRPTNYESHDGTGVVVAVLTKTPTP